MSASHQGEQLRKWLSVLVALFLVLSSLVGTFSLDLIDVKTSSTKVHVDEPMRNAERQPYTTTTRQHRPHPTEFIAVNPNSSYVISDISNILHIPAEARVEIHLQPETARRCHNPVFKGRISGWSLSMIKFEGVVDDIVVGSYDLFHMPLSGDYHVEILLLLCEKYKDDARTSLNLMTVCLEDGTEENDHITSTDTASIKIDLSHHTETATNLDNIYKGRWLHKSLLTDQHQLKYNISDLRSDGRLLELEQPEPVMTPYQPEWCINYLRKKESCVHLNEDRKKLFQEYKFLWNSDQLNQPGLDALLEKYEQRLLRNGSSRSDVQVKPTARTPLVHACFVGVSHSRDLKNSCRNDPNYERSPLNCSQMTVFFPETVTEETVSRANELGCTHVVLGLFQWPFSKTRKRESGWDNVNFTRWEDDMTKAVELLQQQSSVGSESPIQRILLRSAHPNGFGWKHRSCPPEDFRTPINAEIATTILKEIADGFSEPEREDFPPVSFIDTSFLIDAVWDSAPDWSHYAGEVSVMEAKFIISEILKDTRLHF